MDAYTTGQGRTYIMTIWATYKPLWTRVEWLKQQDRTRQVRMHVCVQGETGEKGLSCCVWECLHGYVHVCRRKGMWMFIQCPSHFALQTSVSWPSPPHLQGARQTDTGYWCLCGSQLKEKKEKNRSSKAWMHPLSAPGRATCSTEIMTYTIVLGPDQL